MFLLSTLHHPSSREGANRKAVHVRKFQPREQAGAKDSEQRVALGETETGCAGGGVVTGDLKSHHFLGPPEGIGRAKLLRGHSGPTEHLLPVPKPCNSVGVVRCCLGQ